MLNSPHRHLSWADVSLFMEEDVLPNLIERVENDLEQAVADFNTKCDEEMRRMSSEDREQYGASKSDEYWEISEFAPRIMRRSLLSMIYGTLENRLKQFCHSAHTDGLCAVVPKRKDWHLSHSQDYLMTKIGLPDTNFERRWNILKGYKAVRNIVVHNDGVLSDDEQSARARAFIQRAESIAIQDENFIHIEKGFCNRFAEFASRFLMDILAELKKRPALSASDGA